MEYLSLFFGASESETTFLQPYFQLWEYGAAYSVTSCTLIGCLASHSYEWWHAFTFLSEQFSYFFHNFSETQYVLCHICKLRFACFFYLLTVPIHDPPLPPFIPSVLPHHADLGHLSLQLGARHVLEVVVVAALPAPGVRLHDEVLHVQRSARDPCCVGCLAHRRAELGRSVVPAGLLGQRERGRERESFIIS